MQQPFTTSTVLTTKSTQAETTSTTTLHDEVLISQLPPITSESTLSPLITESESLKTDKPVQNTQNKLFTTVPLIETGQSRITRKTSPLLTSTIVATSGTIKADQYQSTEGSSGYPTVIPSSRYPRVSLEAETLVKIEPKGANLTCENCYTLNRVSLVWIFVGFSIGGLIFGLIWCICCAMGNNCCSKAPIKTGMITDNPEAQDRDDPSDVIAQSSTEPTSQINTSLSYGPDNPIALTPQKPPRILKKPFETEVFGHHSFVNHSFSDDSSESENENRITRHYVDQTTSISFEGEVVPSGTDDIISRTIRLVPILI